MISADPREDARHRRAHALAEQAAVLAHVGDLARARDVYGQAGDLAAAVARACPLGVDSLGPFIAARAVTVVQRRSLRRRARPGPHLPPRHRPRSLRPIAPPGVAGPHPDRGGHDGAAVRSPAEPSCLAHGGRLPIAEKHPHKQGDTMIALEPSGVPATSTRSRAAYSSSRAGMP